VAADAYFPITGRACDELERASVEHIRDQLVDRGFATAAEIDQHVTSVTARALDLATSPMISAWGRRPPDTSPSSGAFSRAGRQQTTVSPHTPRCAGARRGGRQEWACGHERLGSRAT
jgi:hypothetical protein